MDPLRRTPTRAFEDLDPALEWKLTGPDQEVVEISLPGFRKDQVRVQVDNDGVLRVTGERPARGGRRVRFEKDILLPVNCDPDAVRARFEGEKLIITIPVEALASSSEDLEDVVAPIGKTKKDATEEPKLSPTPQGTTPLPPPSPDLKDVELEPPISEITKDATEEPKLSPTPQGTTPPPPPPPPSSSKLEDVEPPIGEITKDATKEPKLPPTPHGTPAAVPAGQKIPISVAPPSPPPPHHPEEAPEQQPQGTKAPGEDGKVSGPSPQEKKKVSGSKVDEAIKGGTPPLEKKQQAEESTTMGEAPTTTAAAAAPGPARQLLLNIAAAVAVIVWIIVAVWRTLRS